MNTLQAIIIAIVEGLTEFLPVSSTGHMILASTLMGIHEDAFVKTFEIAIQLGAILAIVMLYAKRFLQGLTIYYKLLFAFLPTAVIGFLAYDFIKMYLFNPIVVATSLIIGGIILILLDKKVVARESKTDVLENIDYKHAFFIGLIQCFSMIPGVSRAAATIILLAVPTMFAATGYDLLKTPLTFTQTEIGLLAIGLVVAFITAWIAVKVFLKLVEKYGFKHFGYYRIIIGVVFLLWMNKVVL